MHNDAPLGNSKQQPTRQQQQQQQPKPQRQQQSRQEQNSNVDKSAVYPQSNVISRPLSNQSDTQSQRPFFGQTPSSLFEEAINSNDIVQIINLSDKILTQSEVSVMEKDLKFCLPPTKSNVNELRTDIVNFSRKLRLEKYSFDT